ncbi:ABC transporter permease [Streptomyces sp. NPDC051940]|uniref:ABC transporter permease n=1 Tax=Streptomyces sp. NPDC051940 TaxID=3155675 RepID=UPI003424CCEA
MTLLEKHPAAPSPAAALAAAHGLTRSGARPPLPDYLRGLWGRRHFVWEFARAKHEAQYAQTRLGQLWQLAVPLLNASVYYLVFGLLMHARKGVPDYIPFLVTGVFVFTFTQRSVLAGVRAVSGNRGLVRAVHFPRAALPVALVLAQLRQLGLSMVVVAALLVGGGAVPSVRWLEVVPALGLQLLFNTGLALVFARLGSRTPDLAQLLPFVMRTWMYASGVMYSISRQAADAPAALRAVLSYNPAALWIDLARAALIDSFPADGLPPYAWAAATAWALAAAAAGLCFFWQGEEEYGRE